MIETTCPCCGVTLSLHPGAVILGRYLPAGDGTVTFRCTSCGTPVCIPVTNEEVMAVVFTGARAIDIESVT